MKTSMTEAGTPARGGGKAGRVAAAVCAALAAVLLVGSLSFLSPCVHEDGSFGSCHWSGPMLAGLGGLLLVMAVMALVTRRRAVRGAVCLCMMPTALLGLLTPGVLISLCRMATMRCRAITQPAAMLLCGGILIAAGLGWLVERKG